MQRLENPHLVALLHEVASCRQPRRPAADDGDLLSRGWSFADLCEIRVLLLVVGDEAFEIADAERLHLLSHQAATFAMVFLGTDAAGNRGKHVVFADLGRCSQKIAGDNQLHELLHVDADWTFIRTCRLRAFQTAQRFLPGQFCGVAQVYLAEVVGADLRKLFRHLLARHLHALFEGKRIQRRRLAGGHRRPPLRAQTSSWMVSACS